MPSIAEQDEQMQTARPTSAAGQSIDAETQTAASEDGERAAAVQSLDGDAGSIGPLAPDTNRSGESEAPDAAAKEGTALKN